MKKLFHQREVAKLMGISPGRVRAWEKQGLISPRRQERGALWFDFQGLVAFRTVRELRRQGVSLGKIKKCVARLQKMHPDGKQPLAEARLAVFQGQLIVGKNRERFTPEGQLFLDFTAPDSRPVPLPVEDYDEILLQALEDEERGRLQEARKKYEAILAALPDHLDALVNLGNILCLSGADTAAAAHYLKALAVNPDHVEANYNLASLLESRGELEGAVALYQRAIRGDPDFAEAHFNLAMVLEMMGDQRGARTHWRRFLALEPGSQWAVYIKKRLEEG